MIQTNISVESPLNADAGSKTST